MNRYEKIIAALSVLPLALAPVFRMILPERIPVHWNLAGQINRWGSSWELILTFQGMLLIQGLIYLFLRRTFRNKPEWILPAQLIIVVMMAFNTVIMFGSFALAYYSGRGGVPLRGVVTGLWLLPNLALLLLGRKYAPALLPGQPGNVSVMRHILLATLILFLGIGIIGLIGVKLPVRTGGLIFAGIGWLFIIIGNVMPKLKTNPWAGIRIKWTMEDPEIWYKTHRLAGRLWIVGGLIMMIAFLSPPANILLPAVTSLLFLMVGIPVLYARHLARRKKMAAES